MRTAPILIACLAFALAATHAFAMTSAEKVDYTKFKHQCGVAGGTFTQIKRDVYQCKYPGGSLQICSYAGPVGYCYGQEAPQNLGSTRAH